jgi:hypothetical protein
MKSTQWLRDAEIRRKAVKSSIHAVLHGELVRQYRKHSARWRAAAKWAA